MKFNNDCFLSIQLAVVGKLIGLENSPVSILQLISLSLIVHDYIIIMLRTILR